MSRFGSGSDVVDDKASRKRKRSVARRTLHYYWQATRAQLPMFLLSVIATLCFVFMLSYANPYIMGKVIDVVSGGGITRENALPTFAPYIIAFILANVIGQAGSKLQDYAVWKLEISASYDLATRAFDTLSNQSMTFHSNRYGGSLVSQTNKFMSAYTLLLENSIYAIIPISASAIFTIVMLVPHVPYYVLFIFILLTIYVIVVYRMFRSIAPLNAEAAAAQNRLSGELSDSVTNIMSVKTAGRERYERSIFDAANRDVVSADSKRMRASIRRGVIAASILVLMMVGLIFFVTGGTAWFGVTPSVIVMMFTYTYSLTMQFNRINSVFAQVNRALGDSHDMTLILDEPLLVADDEDATQLEVTEGHIDFDKVGFAYQDSNSNSSVFDGFTLDIPGGQHVGLVGRSGSGKTTLTTLLLRLSNIQKGSVLIDDQDISHVTQESLRQHIAYVPQEPLLFHRSISENIAYGRPDATPDEIRRAAERANALEFIEKLPDGFDTEVGERGVKLSGGQRQRIAIARAILTDAPILVLDEATSALDSESEKLIQDALVNLMEGRTSIVVAHRLSTVARLDRIVVLQDGAIVEDGTHGQLVKAGGEYERLWDRQTGSFIGDE